MSFIIRSNPDFNNGGLVLQAHTTRVAEDGFVEVSMNFACLATALQRNLFRFRMELPPPVALPADAAALPLETNNVYLNSLDTTTDKGIGYLRAVYVGSSLDQKQRIARAVVARSFSGSATFRFRSQVTSVVFDVPGVVTFDYQAEALSAEWSSLSAADKGPELKPKIVNVTNLNQDVNRPVGPGQFSSAGVFANYGLKIQIESKAVPVGPVYRFSKTATAIYSA